MMWIADSNRNSKESWRTSDGHVIARYQQVPLQYFSRDTPALFECPHCGASGVTNVKSKPSLAACVACMVSVIGICFICPTFDCLRHKQHYCPSGQKVADFKKSHPCAIMDATQRSQLSFAIPA
ncbi:hypothetical protein L7F22_013095 [Adiantum nelumboides]|nr:hypothetical protein [Adiantum nelumboides]